MNEHSREALETYYAEAASWNQDRVQSMHVAQRRAWWIAGTAAAIALLEGVALVLLIPLKTVEPYTLMVDRTSGYVQALKPMEQAKVAPDTALTQSFLAQYVVAREGFDIATIAANYRKVALLSADRARSGYLQAMEASNPASPLALYLRTTLVEARVKSISPVGPDTALVRFETIRTDNGAQPRLENAWVAVIRYRYSPAPMKAEDRFVNPLGFQVVSYRKDQENLPQLVAAGPPGGPVVPAPQGPYYPGPGASRPVQQGPSR